MLTIRERFYPLEFTMATKDDVFGDGGGSFTLDTQIPIAAKTPVTKGPQLRLGLQYALRALM